MTKQIPALFFLVLLAACGGSTNETGKVQTVAATDTAIAVKQKTDTIVSPIQYGPVLQQYIAYLQTLDTMQLAAVKQAIGEFNSVCQGQPELVCDTAFGLLENFHRKAFEQAEKDTTDLTALIMYNEDGKRAPVSERLLQREATLKEHGITIEQEEGLAFPAQDREFLAKQAGTRVSPAMQEYLAQLSKEQEQGFQNDAGLVITPTQLAERTVWWERFTKKHPQFVYADKAAEYQQYFFTWLMMGMDNTPVEEDGALAPDFKAAFEQLQQQYKGTDTEQYITPYLNAWLEKNPAKARQILENYRQRKLLFM